MEFSEPAHTVSSGLLVKVSAFKFWPTRWPRRGTKRHKTLKSQRGGGRIETQREVFQPQEESVRARKTQSVPDWTESEECYNPGARLQLYQSMRILILVPTLVFLGLFIVWAIRFSRMLERRRRIPCPSCNNILSVSKFSPHDLRVGPDQKLGFTLHCDYCSSDYRFTPDCQLVGRVESAAKSAPGE